MKTLLLASALAAASLVPAYADFHATPAPDLTSYNSFECSIVGERQPTPARDNDPTYKINIDLQLDDNGKVTNLGVYHTTRSGAEYDRSQQYANGTVWQTPGKMDWFWSGTRQSVQRMVGEFSHNDRDGWMYREVVTKYNRVTFQMLADCHRVPNPAEVQDPEPAAPVAPPTKLPTMADAPTWLKSR